MHEAREVFSTEGKLKNIVLNNIYLHDEYNPEKEARDFIFNKKNKHQEYYLVLGLGASFHVRELMKVTRAENIMILEPNEEILKINQTHNSDLFEKLKIVQLDNLNQLFADEKFVSFLRKKPSIIQHPTSYQASKDSFLRFLTFRSSTKMHDVFDLINNEVKDVLNLGDGTIFNKEAELKDAYSFLKQNKKAYHFFKAINVMIESHSINEKV